MTIAETKARELETKIRKLEAEVSRSPTPENVSELVEAYLEQREPRSLERALTLVLRNLEPYRNRPKFIYQALRVLTAIKDNTQAAKLAVELADSLIRLEPQRLRSYADAALVHWRVGNAAAAIELSEVGLRKAADESETQILLHLKGNLAYYYTERGLPQDAPRARELAEEAYRANPRASRADTLGYVLLRFARNQEDLEQAGVYFTQAKKQLQDAGEENSLLDAHIKELALRRSGGIGVG